MKKVTLKSIAKALGVSVSTVSKALKNSPEISPRTRERILEYCRLHHYEPNRMALGLRHRKTGIIGVIVPQTGHYFFSRVITGIQKVAEAAGYRVLIAHSNNETTAEAEWLRLMGNGYTDGVLLTLAKETLQRGDFRHFLPWIQRGFPLVFFDRYPEKLPVSAVIINDTEAGRRATEHLLGIGKRRPALITTPVYLSVGYRRELGFRQALKKHGLRVDENRILRIDERKPLLAQIQGLFRLNPPPDAIFGVNEQYAATALNLARQMGMDIPGDLAVIGFSDGMIARHTYPPLSTVVQHGFRMGQTAAELLFSHIRAGETPPEPQIKIIDTDLVVRGSTGSHPVPVADGF